MLNAFAQDVWLADGPTVTAALGFQYPTRMVVIRLPDHRLWVWSPIELSPALRSAVDALGQVAFIVAPNHLHHLSLPAWAAAWPGARVYGAPDVAQKRPDVSGLVPLGFETAPPWSGIMEAEVVDARPLTTEWVFFHRPSKTALICDLLQQFPPGWHRGWRAAVARMDRMICEEPTMPVKFRMAIRRHPSARTALKRISDWGAERLVIAHGAPVRSGAAAVLDRAFVGLPRD